MGKVVAVVQARMGSRRLPGKMLRTIGGVPLIDHVLERLHRVRRANGGPLATVVLATSETRADDLLAEHVHGKWPAVLVVRGSENDVLSRFRSVVETTEAETVVRVTGDCPLLNTAALLRFIEAHLAIGADITNYEPGYEYADKGLEVVRARAILQAAVDPRATPADREHVTSLMYRHPETYRVNYLRSEPWLRRGDVRLTVDTAEDLAFFESVFDELGDPPEGVDLSQTLRLIDRRPDLAAINAGSGRKSSMHEARRLGFRCDGGPALGLGHVVGSLRLADLAARDLSAGVELVSREDSATLSVVREASRAIEVLPPDISPERDIARLVEKAQESLWSGVVINFCKADLERYQEFFPELRAAGLRIIFMDNPMPPGCWEGDLLINALPHPDYPGYRPEAHPNCLDGLEYFLPGGDPGRAEQRSRPIAANIARILVSMGGGAVAALTNVVLGGLAAAGFDGEVDVVLGAAAREPEKVEAELDSTGLRGSVSVGVEDLRGRIRAADLGFTALGLTTYEMASAGLPALIVAGSEFHAAVAQKYCREYGTAQCVGWSRQVNAEMIAAAVRALDTDTELRHRMSKAGGRVGSRRNEVVRRLNTLLSTRKED